MTYTKHCLFYSVSSSFISTSKARGSISDSLSVTYTLCSDFETNGPSDKCPKGKKRCTAVCIAEAHYSHLVDDLSHKGLLCTKKKKKLKTCYCPFLISCKHYSTPAQPPCLLLGNSLGGSSFPKHLLLFLQHRLHP